MVVLAPSSPVTPNVDLINVIESAQQANTIRNEDSPNTMVNNTDHDTRKHGLASPEGGRSLFRRLCSNITTVFPFLLGCCVRSSCISKDDATDIAQAKAKKKSRKKHLSSSVIFDTHKFPLPNYEKFCKEIAYINQAYQE